MRRSRATTRPTPFSTRRESSYGEQGRSAKGAGLCHGTAGNGCAFLALHDRTGDERWLDRARAFAMHALEQIEGAELRHSLWTGDIGVALYLHACIDGWDGMPVLDVL